MPNLNFLLTNPEIYLVAEKDSEKWSLRFDAKNQRSMVRHTGFVILCDGEQYDGFGTNGRVIIRENADELLEEKPGYIRVDYFDPKWPASDNRLPFFVIDISLPVVTFQRLLNVNPEAHLIQLDVNTDFSKGGLVYGDDPDGLDIVWSVEKQNHAYVESIHLSIKQKNKGTGVELNA
jgi:hypothetical protein